MKFSDVLRMASGNMWRNKGRTILTIVAIFIAALTITITTAIGAGVSTYLDKQTDSFGSPNLMSVVGEQENAGDGPAVFDPNSETQFGRNFTTLSSADVDKIEALDGVEWASPFSSASPSSIGVDGAEQFVLTTQKFVKGQKVDVVAGSDPGTGDKPEIIISTSYVKALGFSNDKSAVGKTVKIGVLNPLRKVVSVEATISGVMNPSLLSNGMLFINEALQTKVTSIVNEGLSVEASDQFLGATAYLVDSDPKTIAQVKGELKDLGLTGSTIEDQIGIAKQVFDAITTVLTAFGVIALIAASFGVINTLYMSVQDRTKEIGLMKASGLSAGRVFGLFSFEAMLLGLWGSVLGIFAAWGIGQAVNSLASQTFLKDLPGFDLTLFPVMSLVSIVAIILVITFLAGALPARRAARLDPITALSYE